MAYALSWITVDHVWLAVGFFGQALFASRFFIQLFKSELVGRSVIPLAFWYFSIGGGVITLVALACLLLPFVPVLGENRNGVGRGAAGAVGDGVRSLSGAWASQSLSPRPSLSISRINPSRQVITPKTNAIKKHNLLARTSLLKNVPKGASHRYPEPLKQMSDI